MAKDTYTISAARDERPGTPEMTLPAVTSGSINQFQCAALAIRNRYGSGKKVTITDFFVKDVSTPNSTTSNANFLVQTVSAWTIGNEYAEKTVVDGYVHKFDSGNADLPSQVKFYEDVQAVTASALPFRRIRQMPMYNETRALSDLVYMGHADKDSGLNTASIFRRFNVGGDVTPIIVRAGEGLALTMENNYVYLTVKYWLNFFIRDLSSGECYGCNCAITPDGGRIPFLFINDTGSGHTYQVFNIELAEIGNDIQVNLFSLERIESLDESTGEDVTDIIPHDSANGSLSGLVDCRRDVSVTLFGDKFGAPVVKPILIRDWQTNQGGAPYLSGTMSLNFGARNPNFLNIRNQNSDIILNPGEGVAMFKRTVSEIGKTSIMIRFTVESAVAGGSNTYSRTRVVNV